MKSKVYKLESAVAFSVLAVKIVCDVMQLTSVPITNTIACLFEVGSRFIDIITYTILFVWLVQILLYKRDAVGRRAMNVATITLIITGVIELLSKIAVTLYHTNGFAWMFGYSIVEILILAGIIVCLLKIYVKHKKDRERYHRNTHHGHKKSLLGTIIGK